MSHYFQRKITSPNAPHSESPRVVGKTIGGLLAAGLICVGAALPIQAAGPSSGIQPFSDKVPIAAIAGLYAGPEKQNENGHVLRNYLRIYGDGTVVGVQSGMSTEESAKFLHRGGPSPTLTGRVQLAGGVVDFTTADEVVSIHYHGEVRGDALVLSWKSTSRDAAAMAEVYRLLPGL